MRQVNSLLHCLPDGVRELALANHRATGNGWLYFTSNITLYNAVDRSATWEYTQQGHEFWSGVYWRYIRLENPRSNEINPIPTWTEP